MKYRFEGIGKLGATLMFSALAASPLAWLTNGLVGKIVFFLLTEFSMFLSNHGLIILNMAIADLKTLSEKKNFDGAFDDAFKEIHEKRERLTPEEKKRIDDKVISAFRDFASFGVRER